MSKKAKILIVDDEDQNLRLLEAVLLPEGYDVIMARDGGAALKAVKDSLPDVVLLDVMMPGMDGFEVCRRQKQENEYLPIIMVTSLDKRDSRLKGIESGADDFISKPIDSTELKLKIRNFLKMKNLYDMLETSYRSLKELEAIKDNLSFLIVHDLRTPLTGIKGYLGFIAQAKTMDEQYRSDVAKANQSVELMIEMISNLLDITKMESNELKISPETCGLETIVAGAVGTVESLLRHKSIRFLDEIKDKDVQVSVQKDLIERAIQNILSNAIRFTPENGEINIECSPDEPGFTVVSISDSGRGIPEKYREKIFEKFGTVEMKKSGVRRSTGLGLTFCKYAVELHGGRIWVEDRDGGGSSFRFTLPVMEES